MLHSQSFESSYIEYPQLFQIEFLSFFHVKGKYEIELARAAAAANELYLSEGQINST